MKHSPEYEKFTNLVDAVLSVPASVIKQRVEEHRGQSVLNPNRPGPKSKRKIKSFDSDPVKGDR